jgi:IstB-like ATP binding protein
MLTHPTLDQLRALKLDGMADAFLELEQQDAAKDLTHAEWLALLLDREITNRTTKRTQIRLRAARLRYSQASVEDVNYRAQRQLDKALFQQLATCRWIADKRNLLIGGKCGLGKTWLALCPCPESLPRGIQRVLRAHAPPLRTAGARAWRRQLCSALPLADKGRSADPRRSRSRSPQRRSAARSHGDHRGSPRSWLHADRQSAPCQSLARPHRRAHLRRRYPRSSRP